MIIKGYIFSILYALICLAFAFVLYKFGVAKKTTRKVVHILVGFEWVILNHFMGAGVHFLAVCLLFVLVLLVSYRKNLMPMISSDGDNAPGTVYYAVAMSIMATVCLFVPEMILPFGIGVVCTSVGDGLAGLVGQSITSSVNKKIYNNKTLFGTLANFLFSLVSILALKHFYAINLTAVHCVIIALFATELELFVGKGLDNIAVTLGASFLSFFIVNYHGTLNYVVPILLTPLMIAFAWKKKALTKGGVIAALLVDVGISVALGNSGFLILLSFFVLGVLSDKIKKKYKKSKQNEHETAECRSYKQVLANSFVSLCLAIMYVVTEQRIFVVGFVAGFAEALSDTFASGFGVFSKHTMDIVRFGPCKKGLSGGVSFLGSICSVFGAALIVAVAFTIGLISVYEIGVVILAGFLGCVADSILGAIVQVKYKCSICGEIVEKKEHCKTETVRSSGLILVDNNLVNFLSTIVAAVLSIILIM